MVPPRTGAPEEGRERLDAPGRVLLFTIHDEAFALAVSAVSGLADCSNLRPVHRAPDVVLGLTEWRGQLLTVLDLPRSLGLPPADPPLCLIRLSPPLHEAAFRLPANVRLGPDPARTSFDPADPPGGFVSGHVLHEGSRVALLDPHRLIEQIESALRERS